MKEAVQRLGRSLSGMVMPNISVFIAWGFITALFISTGWLPNETLAKIVEPMNQFLLPILIGYTGGSMVYKQRGGRCRGSCYHRSISWSKRANVYWGDGCWSIRWVFD